MSHAIFRDRAKIAIAMLIVLALACNMPGGTAPTAPVPAYDPTKAALEFQATAMSQKLTEQALATVPEPQATQEVPPTPQPTATTAPATEVAVPTGTQDLEARMK